MGELGNHLSGGPCRVLSSNMRVDTKSAHVYPDVTVVSGTPEFIDRRKDTLTNPKLVVEVLSPSTRNNDLGAKTRLYMKMPILSDVIFIGQDKIWIEQWHRSGDGGWKNTTLEALDGILEIESLSCNIPVFAIYSGVDHRSGENLD